MSQEGETHSFSVCMSSLMHFCNSWGGGGGVGARNLNDFSDIEKSEQDMLILNS